MKCPAGVEPWRFHRDGTPMPLFVPPALLDVYRRNNPRMWVEVQPEALPYNRALTPSDMQE